MEVVLVVLTLSGQPIILRLSNVKLDFTMTLKEQKFAKISIREISKIEKFAIISNAEASFAKISILQKLVSAKINFHGNV